MANTVDNRIVEMQFNNQQFERNIGKSILSLDRLKQGLNLEGAAKGIDRIEQTLKGFTLDPVVDTLDSLNSKFDAVSNAGVRALNRIKDQAIDTGLQLVKSLTIGQANAGFGKYEAKTQAVATMQYAIEGGLTEEGTARIYKQLDRLQWYADETSYSFSAMTDGMAKFVAAGATLEEAEQSMEGIANWAAMAGVGAQSYKFLNVVQQLSQAAGSGVVMGQDWSSIETATMATREFKQAVIDVAKQEGNLVEIDGKLYGANVKLTESNKEQHAVTVDNLSKTLHDKWLTFDVLNKILNKYAKDPAAFKAAQVARTMTDAVEAAKDAVSSGWAKTYELIFGDVNQSAVFFTDLANALIAATDKITSFRNEVLETWNKEGGRDSFIRAFWNIWKILGGISRSFEEAFGLTAEGLTKRLGTGLVELTERFERASSAVLGLFEAFELVSGDESEEVEETVTAVTGDLAELQKYAQESAKSVEGMINTGSVKMKPQTEQTFRDLVAAYQELDSYISSGNVTAEGLEERFTRIEELNGKAAKTNKLMKSKVKALEVMRKELKGYKDISLETTSITRASNEELSEEEKQIAYRNQRLVEIFTGLKDFFGIFTDALDEARKGFASFAKQFKPLIIPILNVISSLSAYVSHVRKTLKINKTFQKHVERIKNAFGPLTDRIGEAGEKLNEFANMIYDRDTNTFFNGPIGEKFKKIFEGAGSAIEIANRALSHMVYFGSTVMSKFVAPMAGKIGTWFLDRFAALGDWITRVDTALQNSNLFQKIRDDIDLLGKWLDENLDPYLKKISDFISPITSTIEQFFGATGDSFIAAIEVNTDDAATLKEKIGLRIQAFETAFNDTEIGQRMKELRDKIDGFFDPIIKALEPITRPIGQLLRDLWSSAASAVTSSGAKPDRYYENLDEYISPTISEEIGARLQAFADSFSNTETGQKIQEIVESINSFFDPIIKALEPITRPIGQILRDLWSSAASAVTSSGAKPDRYYENLDEYISPTIAEELQHRLDVFAEAFNNTETGQKIQEIVNSINGFFDPIIKALEPIAKPVVDVLRDVWTSAASAISSSGAKSDRFYENLDEYVQPTFIDEIGARIDAFGEAFSNTETGQKVQKVADNITNFFQPIVNALNFVKEHFAAPLEGIKTTISGIIEWVIGILGKIFGNGDSEVSTKTTETADDMSLLDYLIENTIKPVAERIFEGIGWVIDKMMHLFDKYSVKDITKFGIMMVATIQAITSIGTAVADAWALFNAGTDIVETIQEILENIDTFLGGNTWDYWTRKIMRLSASVMLLGIGVAAMAEGVATLAEIAKDPQGVLSMINGEAGIIGIGFILSKFIQTIADIEIKTKGDSQSFLAGKGLGVALKFYGIAKAFQMLADAVKTLAGLHLDGVLLGEAGLAGIAYILSTFINNVANVNTGEKLSGGGGKNVVDKIFGGFGIGVAAKFIGIATAFQMLADAVKTLSKLNVKELLIGEAGLGGIALTLATFIKTVGGVNTKQSTFGSAGGQLAESLLNGFGIGVAAKFISVAKAFQMLADAVKTLSKLNVKELLIGETGLGGIAVILYEFMQKTAGISTKKSVIGKAGKEIADGMLSGFGFGVTAKFISIAKSFQMLSDAVKSLSKLNVKQILIGEGGLAGIAGILYLFMKSVSGVTTNKSLMNGGLSEVADSLMGGLGFGVAAKFISIAESFKMLADAVVKLSSLKLEEILIGTGGLGGIAFIFSEFIRKMSTINMDGSVIDKLTGNVGIIAIAWAFDKLANALSTMGSMKFTDMLKGLLGGGGALVLLEQLVTRMSAIELGGVTEKITGSFGVMALAWVFDRLSSSIERLGSMEFASLIQGMIGSGGTIALLAGVTRMLSGISVGSALQAAADLAILVGSLGAVMAAVGALTATFPQIDDWIEKGGDTMRKLGRAVGGLIGGFIEGLMPAQTAEEKMADFKALAAQLVTFGEESSKIRFDESERAVRVMERLGDLAGIMSATSVTNGSITTLEQFIRDLEGLGGAMSTFSLSVQTFNIDQAESAVSIVERLINLAKMMNETQFDENSTANGWEGAIGYMTQMIQQLTMNEQFGSGIGDFAASIMNGIADGLNDNANAATSAIFSVMGDMLDGAVSKISGFESVGRNISIGLGNGVYNESGYAYRAVKDVVEEMLAIAQNTSRVESPSKITTWIGEMITKGLGVGVLNEAPRTYNAMEDVMNGMLARVSTMMSEDVSAQPTIRPVLDLTDITTGIAAMNGMLPGTFGMKVGNIFPTTSALRASSIGELETRSDSTEVVNAIYSLGDRLDMLEETMAGMQVVLDTGAAVGGLAPKMNKEFGNQALLDERNI